MTDSIIVLPGPDFDQANAIWLKVLETGGKATKGGPGSGNFDHAGRPGHRGGSAPAQDGDDAGTAQVFHGTSKAYLDSIKEHGLVAKKGAGADAWAAKRGWNVQQVKVAGQDVSVFLTPDRSLAELYSKYAAEMSNGDPVVLEIDVPADQTSLLIADENQAGGLRFEGTVPPEWINWEAAKPKGDSSKAAPIKLYLVALVDDAGDVAKGGPGSGNFDHAGRPGEVGGSAPTDSAKPSGKVKFFGDVEKWAEFGVDQDAIASVASVPGCNTEIKLMYIKGPRRIGAINKLMITGTWTDRETGAEVGKFERVLHSNKTVKLLVLELNRGYVSSGLGTKFARNWLDMMAAHGYTKAELEAGLTIGRYAWAKEGAQYKDSYRGEVATNDFKRWLSDKGISDIRQTPTFTTPQDVANYKHPKGVELSGGQINNPGVNSSAMFSLGKAFMLDFDGHGLWDGVFDLTKLNSYRSQKSATVMLYKADTNDGQDLVCIEGSEGSDVAFWAAYLTEDETGTPVLFDDAGDVTKGGPGSGNFGHEGRPGEVGGSASDDGSAPREVPKDDEAYPTDQSTLGRGSGIAEHRHPLFSKKPAGEFSPQDWDDVFEHAIQKTKAGQATDPLGDVVDALDEKGESLDKIPKGKVKAHGGGNLGALARVAKAKRGKAPPEEKPPTEPKGGPEDLEPSDYGEIVYGLGKTFAYTLRDVSGVDGGAELLTPDQWAGLPEANLSDYLSFAIQHPANQVNFSAMIAALRKRQAPVKSDAGQVLALVAPGEIDAYQRLLFKGGPGSGNFGHAGRPGEVGGSRRKDGAPKSGLRKNWDQTRTLLINGMGQGYALLDFIRNKEIKAKYENSPFPMIDWLLDSVENLSQDELADLYVQMAVTPRSKYVGSDGREAILLQDWEKYNQLVAEGYADAPKEYDTFGDYYRYLAGRLDEEHAQKVADTYFDMIKNRGDEVLRPKGKNGYPEEIKLSKTCTVALTELVEYGPTHKLRSSVYERLKELDLIDNTHYVPLSMPDSSKDETIKLLLSGWTQDTRMPRNGWFHAATVAAFSDVDSVEGYWTPFAYGIVYKDPAPGLKDAAREIYKRTQAFYDKKRNKKPVELFRGVKGEIVVNSPFEAWTPSQKSAQWFADNALAATGKSGHVLTRTMTDTSRLYFTYESMKEYWPDERDLRGKKEHTFLGLDWLKPDEYTKSVKVTDITAIDGATVTVISPSKQDLTRIREIMRRHKVKLEDEPEEPANPPSKGGPGSGNFGHSGRPGEVGGSAPAGSVEADDQNWNPDHVFASRSPAGLSKDEWAKIFAHVEARHRNDPLKRVEWALADNGHNFSDVPKTYIVQYGHTNPILAFRWLSQNPKGLSSAEVAAICEKSGGSFSILLDAAGASSVGLQAFTPEQIASMPGANARDYLRYAAKSSATRANFDNIVEAIIREHPTELDDFIQGMKVFPITERSLSKQTVSSLLKHAKYDKAGLRNLAIFLDADSGSMSTQWHDLMKGEAVYVREDGTIGKGAPAKADVFKKWMRGDDSAKPDTYSPSTNYTDTLAVDRKSDVVAALARGSGLTPDEADEFVRQWSRASNNANMRSLGVQEVAADEFGVELSEWQKSQINRVRAGGDLMAQYLYEDSAGIDESKTKIRRAVRSVYERTQEKLKSIGVNEVHLYRGVKLSRREEIPDAGQVIEYDDSALSSWSLSPRIASEFAVGQDGMIVSAVFPRERIYSTPLTGPGCTPEEEVIVIGRKEKSYAVVERSFRG